MSSGDILQLITSALNLGVLGVVFWLFVGGRLHSSAEMDRVTADRDRLAGERAKEVSDAVASARADLLKELERILAEKADAEHQRDDSRQFIVDQLMPILGQFVAATDSLLPVLQGLIRREDPRAIAEPRPRRRSQ